MWQAQSPTIPNPLHPSFQSGASSPLHHTHKQSSSIASITSNFSLDSQNSAATSKNAGTDNAAAARTTYKMKNQGKRYAQIVKLKPEFVDKYKEVHRRVWPEVLAAIKEAGIEDYSIYHDKDSGILFATFKYVGYNYAGDMEHMRENPKVQEWWKMTDGFQESLVPGATGSAEGEPWWKPVEEVFYNP